MRKPLILHLPESVAPERVTRHYRLLLNSQTPVNAVVILNLKKLQRGLINDENHCDTKGN
jgi:hypothetical protein